MPRARRGLASPASSTLAALSLAVDSMPFDHPLPALPADVDFWSLRFVEERMRNAIAVRKNVAHAVRRVTTDRGVMATVYADGGYGYAATGDTSPAGLARGARARRGVGARDRPARR